MVVEILDRSQEWHIELPNEDVYRDRPLEARDSLGNVHYQFHPSPWRGWIGREMQVCTPSDPRTPSTSTPCHEIRHFTWQQILGLALVKGWRLFSLPPETGDGA